MQKRLGSRLLWATLTTVVCCCLLGTFQMVSVRNERDALLQSRAKPAVQKHVFERIKAALMKDLATKSAKGSTVGHLKNHGATNAARTKSSLHERSEVQGTTTHNKVNTRSFKSLKAPRKINFFNRLKSAMVKHLGLKSSSRRKVVLQKKADVAVEAEQPQQAAGDVDEEVLDPVKNTVYVYAGRETKPHSTELTAFILQSGFGIEKVGYINSASDADIRAATWDDDCKAIIFPALKDIPDFGPNAVKDIKSFVSQGGHESGTLLFLGSPVEVHLINQIFGFELLQDYKEGPYYKNGRYASTSVWEPLPSRVGELGQTEALGFQQSTLPPESRSYYDSFGDSVATCTRYDLGRVCYLAQDFSTLEQLPELLQAAGGDAADAAAGEYSIEAMERTTDTWLGIFQAMLFQTEADVAPVGIEQDQE